jgi:hypothetical protein
MNRLEENEYIRKYFLFFIILLYIWYSIDFYIDILYLYFLFILEFVFVGPLIFLQYLLEEYQNKNNNYWYQTTHISLIIDSIITNMIKCVSIEKQTRSQLTHELLRLIYFLRSISSLFPSLMNNYLSKLSILILPLSLQNLVKNKQINNFIHFPRWK